MNWLCQIYPHEFSNPTKFLPMTICIYIFLSNANWLNLKNILNLNISIKILTWNKVYKLELHQVAMEHKFDTYQIDILNKIKVNEINNFHFNFYLKNHYGGKLTARVLLTAKLIGRLLSLAREQTVRLHLAVNTV